MNYSTTIDIDLPIDRVIELFDNPDNMKKWQPQLESFEHVSGESGKPGAKSKLKYKMGKREVEMIETITVNNLPDEFSGTYGIRQYAWSSYIEWELCTFINCGTQY